MSRQAQPANRPNRARLGVPLPPQLSYEVRSKQKATDRIQRQTSEQRTQHIINVFTEYFGNDIQANKPAFRARFRKMAESAFKFYRGSAILFYKDLEDDKDDFLAKNPAAGHIFIHGDLHAENFGTYLNNDGILNFDVNDFDEGYVGPFTWDIKRLAASLYLVCYAKGFSDKEIRRILSKCIEAYVEQIEIFCRQKNDQFALTLKNTTGKVRHLLNKTRVKSHVELLDSMTYIENFDRKFKRDKYVSSVEKDVHEQLMIAFQKYLESVPDHKKHAEHGFNSGEMTYQIKDIVQRSSPGIGSAGRVSYSFLIEGRSETLENDVVLYLKPAQKSALSVVVKHPEIEKYFQHDGLRMVLCSYAMQASTPKWLGYTTMNGIPCLVDAVTAHAKDMDWSDINDFDDVAEAVEFMGKATAKIHCVADADCINTPKDIASLPFSIIPRNTEKTIRDTIRGQESEFIEEIVDFGMIYGALVRRDHDLFFEALRNHQIPILE